jgi:hypothetical protein
VPAIDDRPANHTGKDVPDPVEHSVSPHRLDFSGSDPRSGTAMGLPRYCFSSRIERT